MVKFDTPDQLSDIQKERWSRGGRTIANLLGAEVLKEAVMHGCDEDEQWWELQVARSGEGSDEGVDVASPRRVDFDEPPAHCWRLEVVLESPVDFGTFVQLALRFPDATLFLPEVALHRGECKPIQERGDLDLVTIFEI